MRQLTFDYVDRCATRDGIWTILTFDNGRQVEYTIDSGTSLLMVRKYNDSRHIIRMSADEFAEHLLWVSCGEDKDE